MRKLERQVVGAVAGGHDLRVAAYLAAIARAYVDFATTNTAMHELMFAFKYDPTASDELTEAKQRAAYLATKLIEDGQRGGEVREGPPDIIAVPLTAALPADWIEESLNETILRGYAP